MAHKIIRRLKEIYAKKYNFVVCAMFKDEAIYLEEWINFHIGQGVEHFFLFNDESTDNFEEVLAPWIKKGFVTINECNGLAQEEIYESFISNYKKRVIWAAFIDIDEFLYCDELTPLPLKMKEFEGFSCIFITWRILGFKERPEVYSASLIEKCIWAAPTIDSSEEAIRQYQTWLRVRGDELLTGCPIQGKSIVRLSEVQKMNPHYPEITFGPICDVEKVSIDPKELISNIFSGQFVPKYGNINLNHYWSRDEASLRQKMKKGYASLVGRQSLSPAGTITSAIKWNEYISQEKEVRLQLLMRKKYHPYIFCIGFNKTATNSLTHLFNSNGLPAVHWDGNKLVERMLVNLESNRKVFDGYDEEFKVFTDLIYADEKRIVEGNRYFKEMNEDYPNSFFILNNRSTDSWLRSRANHNKGKFLEKQRIILGNASNDEIFNLWSDQKIKHERQVRKYFENYDRFLEIDIESIDVAEKISKFLGLHLDSSHWLKLNSTEENLKKLRS